jgi:hypothetical protein
MAESASLIASHSPAALLKTGLHLCLPEKIWKLTAFGNEQSVLSSPVCRGRIAKYGHVSRILEKVEAGNLCSPDCVAEERGFEPSVPFRIRQVPTFAQLAAIHEVNQRINWQQLAKVQEEQSHLESDH